MEEIKGTAERNLDLNREEKIRELTSQADSFRKQGFACHVTLAEA